jgi:hypothetical protein
VTTAKMTSGLCPELMNHSRGVVLELMSLPAWVSFLAGGLLEYGRWAAASFCDLLFMYIGGNESNGWCESHRSSRWSSAGLLHIDYYLQQTESMRFLGKRWNAIEVLNY